MEENKPKLPEISGITELSPLDMNGIKFNKQHTVLTPEILDSLGQHAKLPAKNNEKKHG